ncbi:MAG TPA: fused MFS/spermidine synthase [Vicinamibacteria bacterium]
MSAPSAPDFIQSRGSFRETALVIVAGGLFCLSGVAALVYQVTWQRILALHSGMGIYSVAMIVASFIAGLGIGSHLGGVLSTRKNPRAALRVFAVLEISIALFGAMSCWLFYDVLYLEASWLYTTSWRAGLFHFLALLPPTCLMGMSLPFLVQAMVRDVTTAGRTVGYLYGLNVVGASIGAFLTPWVLIRFLGIRDAVSVAVGLNLLAGVGALSLSPFVARRRRESFAQPVEITARTQGEPFSTWLLLYAVSGFCALSLEIVWFRLIDVGVRGTAFAFGTVLSIYLLGLAAGTLAGARIVGRLEKPLRIFLFCQCAILFYSGIVVLLLALLPTDLPGYAWFFDIWSRDRVVVLGRTQDWERLLRLYLLLPLGTYGIPTFLMGFSFSVLQRAVQDDPETSGRKVGFLQAANVAGNVAGSLVIGLLALDFIGTTGSVRVLVLCGLVFAFVGVRRFGLRGGFGFSVAALIALALLMPGQDDLWNRLHGLEGENARHALIEEDATGVVVVKPEEPELDDWRVVVNGLYQSWLPYGGIHSLLGSLPAMMHPQPRDVSVIGLGSGDTAWAAASREETDRLQVYEIARPQLNLLHQFAATHEELSLSRFLADPRLEIQVADGRNALLRSDDLFDLIVVDALRPVSAYSGNLQSVEFLERSARKLKPGGLMSIWAPTVRGRVSFGTVFPYVVSFDDARVLVGSNHPIQVDPASWRERAISPFSRTYLGEPVVQELIHTLNLARESARPSTAEESLNRDLFPRDEFLSPEVSR